MAWQAETMRCKDVDEQARWGLLARRELQGLRAGEVFWSRLGEARERARGVVRIKAELSWWLTDRVSGGSPVPQWMYVLVSLSRSTHDDGCVRVSEAGRRWREGNDQ